MKANVYLSKMSLRMPTQWVQPLLMVFLLFSGLTVSAQNNPPVADNEGRTTPEDIPLAATSSAPGTSNNLLTGDTDPDAGQTLIITQFDVNGTTTPAGSSFLIPNIGTITINANGSYAFAPVANYNGAVPVITYTVSDGNGGTATGTLTLTVTPVNDNPAVLSPSLSTLEDSPLRLSGSFTDVDGGNGIFTYTITVTAGSGTLTASSVGNVTVTSGSSNSVTLTGTMADINAYMGSTATQPVFTQARPDQNSTCGGSFQITTDVSDNGNTPGPPRTDRNVRNLIITAVADRTNDNVGTIPAGTSKTFNVLTGTNGATADSFEDPNRAITAINGTAVTSGQTVTLANGNSIVVNSDGTIAFTAGSTSGTQTFTYTVTSPASGCTETATVTANVSGPLPVELTRFEASGVENRKALLTWVTASERNAAYFTVQHSLTARDWAEIGRVDAHGTTSQRNTYTFTDPNPAGGVNYYRLLQVDHDGSAQLSPVRSVVLTGGLRVQVSPNPASSILYIKGENLQTATIVSQTGREIGRYDIRETGIDIRSLTPGWYLVVVTAKSGAQQAVRMLKEAR